MDGEPEGLSDLAPLNYNIASTSEILSDPNTAKLESLEKKAVHLRLILQKDFKAADIKWSLFVAAAFSFRYESCLRPFPPAYLKSGVKDMDELLGTITDVPALDLVLQQLNNLENLPTISDVIDLLFYVLVRLKEPVLKTVAPDAHESILALLNMTQPAPKPQYIFQVTTSKSNAEAKWIELAKNNNKFYAFHGNRLENFYTILCFGLQQHLNKNTSVGNGVCLSPELNIVMPQSHGGFGWGASSIGGHLSCVAMCEVIDTPDGINYQRPRCIEGRKTEGDCVFDDDKPRSLAESPNVDNSLMQYIVTNCELVRVRYLLVYAKQPASMRFLSANSIRNTGGIRCWLSKHKMLSILLGYGFMLATIGFANNQPINHYYKLLMKKLDFAYSNVKV